MKYLELGTNERVSCIGIGCMRIAGMDGKDVDALVHTALDEGIIFFDHADIYGGGQSEEIFGKLHSAFMTKLLMHFYKKAYGAYENKKGN